MKVSSLSLFKTNSSQNLHSYYSKENTPKYYPVNLKNDTVNFGMKVNYGTPAVLDKALQTQIAHIHENIDFIQDFFKQFNKKQYLAAKIRDGYTDLVSKRSSGFIFKLPENGNSVEIFKSQTRPNILYISINNGKSEFNGIVIDGGDKLIANYLKLHPHMLPSSIKYMNAEAVKNAAPEKFVMLADEKMQAYLEYIKKIQSGEIQLLPEKKPKPEKVKSSATKFIDRSPESKTKAHKTPPKVAPEDYGEYMTDKVKNIIKKISEFLSKDVKDFPEYITPKLTPSGKALGFKLPTDDGGSLIVMRKTVSGYGSSMPYLSFEKINSDGTLSYTSLDMISNKVLRIKDKGKPHISSDHVVYELTPDEIKKRKIEDKLDYYMKQIFKEASQPKTKAEVEKSVSDAPKAKRRGRKKAEPKAGVITEKPVTKQKDINQPDTGMQLNPDIENIKENMRMLGKKDGEIAATEYFNAFKEQFMKDIEIKMADFKQSLKNLLADIIK